MRWRARGRKGGAWARAEPCVPRRDCVCGAAGGGFGNAWVRLRCCGRGVGGRDGRRVARWAGRLCMCVFVRLCVRVLASLGSVCARGVVSGRWSGRAGGRRRARTVRTFPLFKIKNKLSWGGVQGGLPPGEKSCFCAPKPPISASRETYFKQFRRFPAILKARHPPATPPKSRRARGANAASFPPLRFPSGWRVFSHSSGRP